jgi:hypothetical protein
MAPVLSTVTDATVGRPVGLAVEDTWTADEPAATPREAD